MFPSHIPIVLLATLIKDIKHGVKTSVRYVYLFKVNCDTVEFWSNAYYTVMSPRSSYKVNVILTLTSTNGIPSVKI
jgi:hypothetical protein